MDIVYIFPGCGKKLSARPASPLNFLTLAIRLGVIFFEFLKSNRDTPSDCEVSGKNKSSKVSKNRLIFSAASSPQKLMMFAVEVSIVLQLENKNVTLNAFE